MAERIRIDHGSFESGKRMMEQWNVPKSVKTELLGFLDDLGFGQRSATGVLPGPGRSLRHERLK